MYGLYGFHGFEFGFGFGGPQILCLGKLKKMDLDLVLNPIRI